MTRFWVYVIVISQTVGWTVSSQALLELARVLRQNLTESQKKIRTWWVMRIQLLGGKRDDSDKNFDIFTSSIKEQTLLEAGRERLCWFPWQSIAMAGLLHCSLEMLVEQVESPVAQPRENVSWVPSSFWPLVSTPSLLPKEKFPPHPVYISMPSFQSDRLPMWLSISQMSLYHVVYLFSCSCFYFNIWIN